MRARGWGGWVLFTWLSVQAASGVPQGPQVFTIDAAASHVLIEVGKTGMFGFAGHAHEVLAPSVTGRVSVEPNDWQRSSVSLEFNAAALKVNGKGEPPSDVPQVQQVMLSAQVLDVKRFPTVAFRSRRVSGAPPAVNGVALAIEGDLTLHGVTRPLTIHASATLQADRLTARGTFVIKQTDFGIRPVTAGGGTVKVKDEVQVEFVLEARRAPGAAALHDINRGLDPFNRTPLI
jgi:polyisoprenoid-binding protein YceI